MAAAHVATGNALTLTLEGRRIGLLTAFAGPLGGGVAEAVAAQAGMLQVLGAEPIVFSLAEPAIERSSQRLCEARHVHARILGPASVGFAPAQLSQLLGAQLDLLHLHGIWMHTSRVGSQWAARTGRPYVISPHGMLDPWITARGKWKKALARAGYERGGWSRASAIHALTQSEARDVARETAGICATVIPNPGPPALETERAMPPPVVLYLGRVHPKKNLAGLLQGWREAVRPPDATLLIAGWGADADVASLRDLLDRQSDPSIAFLGPVFGEPKRRLIDSARFAALPSFSEGLPMSLLEAWSAGVPTLNSVSCNLPQGFQAGAALDCGTSAGEIAAAISTAMALDERGWREMSRAALSLARGPFSRGAVANQWKALYTRLLGESA